MKPTGEMFCLKVGPTENFIFKKSVQDGGDQMEGKPVWVWGNHFIH